MEIKLGDITLTAEYVVGWSRRTNIIIKVDASKTYCIDSKELKVAIEALEESCWRP